MRRELGRDLAKIRKRVEAEGISFLTSSLPRLGRAVLDSLGTGKFSCPIGFQRAYPGAALPKMFWVVLSELYNDAGVLKASCEACYVMHALQLCFLYYKYDQPFTPDQVKIALEKYKAIEHELETLEIQSDDDLVVGARDLVTSVFADFNVDLCVPKHGPGAVATREADLEKWEFKRIYTPTAQLFPWYEVFFVSERDFMYPLDPGALQFEKEDRSVARMTMVPKDSRGPRTISLEPLETQYLQQGVRVEMQRILESHRLTRGRVNFSSQQVNRDLATKASVDWSYATLDMSDASDRISNKLVCELFKHTPLLSALQATRSEYVELPDGTTFGPLHKFAPMGSATCFPVESVVHYVLAVTAICMAFDYTVEQVVGYEPQGKYLPKRHGRRSLVYVYGDDLIVATRCVDCVLKCFDRVGLRFNPSKCFIHEYPFRESCGVFAFKGEDVVPAFVRKGLTWNEKRHRRAAWAHSSCALASQLYGRFYPQAAEFVWQKVEEVVGSLPTNPVGREVSYLTRRSRLTTLPQYSASKTRVNASLQVLEYKAPTILPLGELTKGKKRKELSGPKRLLQFLLGGPARQAAPGAVVTRWTPA